MEKLQDNKVQEEQQQIESNLTQGTSNTVSSESQNSQNSENNKRDGGQSGPLGQLSPKFEAPQLQVDIYQDPSQLSQIQQFDLTFKLILIGNSGVGKSCIIRRIGTNTFSDDHEVTIGAEFTTIAAHVNKKSFMKMQLWDSCGQERYNSITRIFYRGSQCVVLVYEVNNAQSLRDLERIWINDIQSNLKEAILILVANKADIDEDSLVRSKRQITYQEGLDFQKKHNINYFTEVSAKTGKGIRPLMEQIARMLFELTQRTQQIGGYAFNKNNDSSASSKIFGKPGQSTGQQSQNSGNGNNSRAQSTKKAQAMKLRQNKNAQNKKNNCC